MPSDQAIVYSEGQIFLNQSFSIGMSMDALD
jgi:hypothetical protein